MPKISSNVQDNIGNIDLYKQPKVLNPITGETSTVFSKSFNINGKEVLLSSVTPEGKFLKTDKEVLDYYKATGKYLGKFDTVEEADKYAEQLHEDYAAGKYDKKFITGKTYTDKQGNKAIWDGKKFVEL